ncbi:MAG: M48 family metallopeptidase [Thermoleophilia bacterium]|nr:M48 family metallopeptidase [Thermoleophilia bacterium]
MRSEVDLGRKGVVWLQGSAIPVERTGADRAVARLSRPAPPPRPAATPVVAAAFGTKGFGPVSISGPASASGPWSGSDPAFGFDSADDPGASGVLLAGGRRRKDSLAAIDRWYRRQARERIEAEVEAESARLRLEPGKVSIRDQRTRWGSCSTSGTLSFNWRLVIGPRAALRYVVIHELVHVEHHNHSRAFWSALTEAMPDWKRPAAWLKANERTLTAYRPRL